MYTVKQKQKCIIQETQLTIIKVIYIYCIYIHKYEYNHASTNVFVLTCWYLQD